MVHRSPSGAYLRRDVVEGVASFDGRTRAASDNRRRQRGGAGWSMNGRPQWAHGDGGHHFLLSGNPMVTPSTGPSLHAAQTRKMVRYFVWTQGWP